MAEELFCWVSEIPARREAAVRAFLSTIGTAFGPGTPLPLAQLDTLHFASLTLYSPRCGDPLLFFECSIDKPFNAFVEGLERHCRGALDRIYEGCEGYPALKGVIGDPSLSDARVRYLSSKTIKKRPQLFHLGHPERPVATIRADVGLRESIRCEFTSAPGMDTVSAAEALRTLGAKANCPRGRVRCRPNHPSWKIDPPSRVPLPEVGWLLEPLPWRRILRGAWLLLIAWMLGVALTVFLGRWVLTEALVAVEFLLAYAVVHYTSSGARAARALVVSLPLAAAVYAFVTWGAPWLPDPLRLWGSIVVLIPAGFLAIAYARIRFVLRPTAPPPPLDPTTVAGLLEGEDHPSHNVYNHVFGLSELRPTWTPIRVVRTWLVLKLLNLFYRVQFVKGQLVSVPTIHFAQWNLIHNRYLLFNVHYDGGADRYLDDFFESLAQGVGFIWFDTVLYPRVTDPRRLKAWVRESQTLPLVRYRAAVYENLTVADINNNKRIRRRLLRPRAKLAERWMARFTTTLPEDPKWFDAVDRLLRRIAPIK
jgi:hypothetical protein